MSYHPHERDFTMSPAKSRFSRSFPGDEAKTVTVVLDGRSVRVPAGVTVAAALLGYDDAHFCHAPGNQQRRGPHCLMGVCFECLVEIDGVRNRQACLEQVRDGMRVDRQTDCFE